MKWIGFDIDGVIADSVPVFLDFLNNMYGRNYKFEDIVSFRFEDCTDLTERDVNRFWRNFTRHGNWDAIKPVKGIKEVMAKAAENHKIAIITGRPNVIKAHTLKWLRENGIHYDKLMFIDKDTKFNTLLKNGIELEFFVEDCFEFARELAGGGVLVYIVDYPWNRYKIKTSKIKRINSVKDILKLIN